MLCEKGQGGNILLMVTLGSMVICSSYYLKYIRNKQHAWYESKFSGFPRKERAFRRAG